MAATDALLPAALPNSYRALGIAEPTPPRVAVMAERYWLRRHRKEVLMLDPEETSPEEVEVVAHSDEDEELTAGCYYNGSSQL